MATGFATTLNSAFLPTPALGLGTPNLFTYNVAPGGTGASFAPTGATNSAASNWSLWTVNANTIIPAGPEGYTGTGGLTGTVVFGGNVLITGNLNNAGLTGNYINYTKLVMAGTGIGPGVGVTGAVGDKIILQYGSTGSTGIGYPVSLGNSGTTLYQSVPAGGNIVAYIGGTGVMNINTQSVSIGLGALGGFIGATGPTGTVAIGLYTAAGTQSVTIGVSGGYTGATSAVAIGWGAGLTGGTGSVAIGTSAGAAGANSVAIGASAGAVQQASGAVALGWGASQTGQGVNAVSLGSFAGQTNQAANAVAMGANAGAFAQGTAAVAFGQLAGQTNQGAYAVALGAQAGSALQVTGTVAVGYQAGAYQGAGSIAIGYQASYTGVTGVNGVTGSITIGYQAGYIGGNPYGIAIGPQAGYFNQGTSAIAIGYQAAGHTGITGYTGTTFAAGYTGGQGTSSIAIGAQAGYQNDGNVQLYTAAYTPTLFGVTGATGTFGPYTGQTGTNGVGLSANGRTIVVPVVGTPNYYLSTNSGASFSIVSVGGIVIASNQGFSACFMSYGVTNSSAIFTSMYTNGLYAYWTPNVTLSPTTLSLITIAGTTGVTNGTLSAAVTNDMTYTLITIGNSLLVSTTGIYWSYNSAPATTAPTFALLGVTQFLSGASSWCQTALSSGTSTSTFYTAILTYSNVSAGTSASGQSVLYWLKWANGTTVSNLSAGWDGVNALVTGLPVFLNTTVYWSAAAISADSKYILAGASNGSIYLSSNGNTTTSLIYQNITFTLISSSVLSIPGTPITAGGLWAGMSSSGQYMCLGTTFSFLAVSYNYGVGWSVLPVYGMLYGARPVMSANGNVIVYATSNTSITGSYFTPMVIYTLTVGSAANTIAIGTGAGFLNQGGNAIAIGAGSGQYSQGTGAIAIGANAGQSNQSANAIAIGTNAGAQNDALISVSGYNGVSYGANFSTPTGVGVSQNGQYITAISYSGSGTTVSVSTTGGLMTAATTQPAITGTLVLMSANGVYQLTLPHTTNTTYYYSANGTAGASITFTSILNNITGGIQGSVYWGTCGAMSSTGQYIIVGNSWSTTSTPPTNYLYYSVNGGALSTPASIIFTVISTIGGSPTNGLPLATTSTYWSMASMSSDARYIIIPYSNASGLTTGIATTHNLYYSTNGGASSTAATITFTALVGVAAGLPSAPTNNGYYWFRGSAMSSSGQYILVIVGPSQNANAIGGVAYLSINGGALSTPATLVFNSVTFPNNLSSYFFISCAMSNSGQYMMVTGYLNVYFYVSYNYGSSWVLFTLPSSSFSYIANVMSGDGTKMVFSAGSGSNIFVYTLVANANPNNNNSNTVAIGNQAGSINQGIYSIAVGAYAGSIYQGAGYASATFSGSIAIGPNAGQYTQGIGAIAIGIAAGQTAQPAGSFYIPPSGTSIRNFSSGGGTNYQILLSTATGEVYYTTTKTFVIDHPTDPARYLVHACLEGPEAGVYYRGAGISARAAGSDAFNGVSDNILETRLDAFDEVSDNILETRCELPDYVRALATDFTILVQAVGGAPRTYSVSPIVDGAFTVYGPPGKFEWRVIGKRADVNVEPLRDEIVVNGDGPYTYAVPPACPRSVCM